MKLQKIMFFKQPNGRMYMYCTDTFNWLVAKGNPEIAGILNKKMEGAEKSIEKRLAKKTVDYSMEKKIETVEEVKTEKKKKWWNIL